MVRCCSISQAAVSVSAGVRPRRGPRLRAMRAPTMEWSSLAALGDVVQEGRHVERAPVLDGGDDPGGERVRVGGLAALDVGQHADGADQVLVHRVVVVHVELHHRHDAAELRDEAAEHAGFVHAPQRRLRVLGASTASPGRCGWPRGRCAACRRSGAASARSRRTRVGVEEGVGLLGAGEEADQVDGIALEHARVGHIQAAVVDAEIAGGADPAGACAR